MTTEDSRTLKTATTLFAIIEVLKEEGSARVDEIADQLDIAPSTAYRHLNTLKEHGYVVNEGDRYRLGMRFLSIGGYLREQRDEWKLARTTIEEIADVTGERAQFIIEEDGRRVTIHMESGSKAVQAGKNLGFRGYLHSSAAGKAMLAELPPKRVEQIIDIHGLPAQTEHTISDRAELLDELETVRGDGFALNDEESTARLRAVGTAVTSSDGRLIGAISVSGPKNRIKPDLFEAEYPDLLLGKADELELKIEYNES